MTHISIGIPTAGRPVMERCGDNTLLKNMLIGKDFHWEKTIEALLPGEVTLSSDPDFGIINRLPLETYLECVVGSEMNPAAPAEFLKAHAVISRSWALGKILGEHPHDETGKTNTTELIINWEDTCDHHGFNVCSDDHCQRYQGVQPIQTEILNAIRETAGMVLRTPDGKLVDTRFSKCCGGRTELFSSCWQETDPSCLKSFVDPWCDLSGLTEEKRMEVLTAILKDYDLANEGGYRWHTTVTARAVATNLINKFGRDIGEVIDLKITQRGPSGRARLMTVTGTKGSVGIGKELMIRRLLSPTHLYSSAISLTKQISRKGEIEFHIDGSGWGHGVGLCQIGAARMALEGHDFHSILSFYYPDSILSTCE